MKLGTSGYKVVERLWLALNAKSKASEFKLHRRLLPSYVGPSGWTLPAPGITIPVQPQR